MTKCSTTSGPFRCTKELDANGRHGGECEAQAPEYATRTEFVSRHGWWFAICATHGLTEHNTVINGCVACRKDLEAKSEKR